MTEKLAATVRAALAGFDPTWVEEALARVAAADTDDPHAICAAVVAALEMRIAGENADTAALQRQNDVTQRNLRADDATYGIAINVHADIETQPNPTIH